MRVFSVSFAFALLLGLSACAGEVEDRSNAENDWNRASFMLASAGMKQECYVAVTLPYRGREYPHAHLTVAESAAMLANQRLGGWTLVSYNQEFNSNRTAVFRSNHNCMPTGKE